MSYNIEKEKTGGKKYEKSISIDTTTGSNFEI